MAVGDDATAAGYPLVPNTGSEGLVRYGAREINRTRDLIAVVSREARPVSRGGTGATTIVQARINLGFRSGTANPSGGANGDIYFKIVG